MSRPPIFFPYPTLSLFPVPLPYPVPISILSYLIESILAYLLALLFSFCLHCFALLEVLKADNRSFDKIMKMSLSAGLVLLEFNSVMLWCVVLCGALLCCGYPFFSSPLLLTSLESPSFLIHKIYPQMNRRIIARLVFPCFLGTSLSVLERNTSPILLETDNCNCTRTRSRTGIGTRSSTGA